MEAANQICNITISLLVAHGIKHVVLSPGSRNAPLIVAAAKEKSLNKVVIVDERSAAFVALGLATSSCGKEPVALICTSGTALLNYSPAIAEAYYRNLPLIVISADRPYEWIDQDDSQTLNQFEALSKFVKKSYNLPPLCQTKNQEWYVNRIVNDAIITSNSGKKGPIHLNIQLDEPLSQYIGEYLDSPRIISMPSTQPFFDSTFFAKIINEKRINQKKVLIIAGFQNCDDESWSTTLSDKLDEILESNPNFALLTESISNINSKKAICNIDRNLCNLNKDINFNINPDIVITFGGALISRFIKQYLRENKSIEHWHIGLTDTTIDCFQSLTYRINTLPYVFFSLLNESIKGINSDIDYQKQWNDLVIFSKHKHNKYVQNCEWSDLKAFSIFLPLLKGNLHLSNGTPIRYHQLFDKNPDINKIYCNRGVSGIDGSTSTAIGFALNSSETTYLVTGDLSAQYDISAFSINNIPPSFKMIVMNNGGGGIFRFIKSTSQLMELEEYFATKPNLPLKSLAEGYNFTYFEANNEKELLDIFPKFNKVTNKPAILAINTPSLTSANILSNYFK